MENKKLLNICECGDIHLIDGEIYSHTIKADSIIVLICAKCGSIKAISKGKKIYFKTASKMMLGMNGDIIIQYNNDNIETINKHVGFIYYNKGISVPMKTGRYADHYEDGVWSDNTCPDIEKMFESLTIKEQYDRRIIMHKYDRVVIDNHAFICKTCKEDALALSSHHIEPFSSMTYDEIVKQCPAGSNLNLEKIIEFNKYFKCIYPGYNFKEPVGAGNDDTPFKEYQTKPRSNPFDMMQQYQQLQPPYDNYNKALQSNQIGGSNISPNTEVIIRNMQENLFTINSKLDEQKNMIEKILAYITCQNIYI